MPPTIVVCSHTDSMGGPVTRAFIKGSPKLCVMAVEPDCKNAAIGRLIREHPDELGVYNVEVRHRLPEQPFYTSFSGVSRCPGISTHDMDILIGKIASGLGDLIVVGTDEPCEHMHTDPPCEICE